MEESALKKTLAYITIAVILGLAVTLLPTWFFLAKANQTSGLFPEAFRGGLPMIKPAEQNDVPTVSPREVEVLAIGFIAALAVYFFFGRKVPRRVYTMPPNRTVLISSTVTF